MIALVFLGRNKEYSSLILPYLHFLSINSSQALFQNPIYHQIVEMKLANDTANTNMSILQF